MFRIKEYSIAVFLFVFLLGTTSQTYSQDRAAQKNKNWTKNELMEPAYLAELITKGEKLPLIISIGPQALIPNSLDVGMMTDSENVENFDQMLDSLPKNTDLVIYCGCCPFEHCPNIRPAVAALKKKNFKNFHLLNLSTSIKADWIDKNYPLTEEN